MEAIFILLIFFFFYPCSASYHEQYRDFDVKLEDKSFSKEKFKDGKSKKLHPMTHQNELEIECECTSHRSVKTMTQEMARRRYNPPPGSIRVVFCQWINSKIFCRTQEKNLTIQPAANGSKVPQLSTPQWESYAFNDKEYIVQVLPVNWEDAKIICRGFHNGSLAILDTKDKAEFLAEALSESQFTLNSVWVGARRNSAEDAEGYRWGPGMELRRTALDVLDNEEEDDNVIRHYPMWLNRTHIPVPEMGADCVALERVKHDRPVFLDLPCHLERAFACERDMRELYPVKEVNTVRCRSGLYHLYDGRMDWHQAAAYCVLRGMALANIASLKCLKKLGMSMLKNRPSIENAWVGAKGTLGHWTWIDTGVSVFKTPAMSDASPDSWPPMRDISNVKQNGCLQLDRHASHPPVFLEARCDRKMQFICYAGSSRKFPQEIPSDDQYYYILVRQLFYWQHAYQNCLKMNGTLASLDNKDILIQLLLLMGENKDEPIEHIWVSGRLNMTKDIATEKVRFSWYNPNGGKIIPSPKGGIGGAVSGLYMPPWWVDEEFTMDSSCLNLDRQDHLIGLVYGLPCDTAQYSVCMIEKPQKLQPPVIEPVTEAAPAVAAVTEAVKATTFDGYESKKPQKLQPPVIEPVTEAAPAAVAVTEAVEATTSDGYESS